MKTLNNLMILSLLFTFSTLLEAAPKKAPKVQEVHFDGSDVDGAIRKPDGLYLVQKKSIDFVPLYRVREKFDQSIKESVHYLR